MRPTVLLFDVDGTLIHSGGAGRRAIERAFEEAHGRRDACASFSFAGMTDRAIVRAGLSAIGHPVDEAEIDRVIAVYLGLLEREVAEERRFRVNRGVAGALDEACARARTAVGLGTGNVRQGARVKLDRVGIHGRFRFGGFGCDSEDRAELVRIGAERGAALLGSPLADCRVVVIGDTPRDVAAARAVGADSLAVATGPFDVEALAGAGATRAFADLAAPGALAFLCDG
jgi:phosphoglycolate phosphatase-like HAD superfamily hydrolase